MMRQVLSRLATVPGSAPNRGVEHHERKQFPSGAVESRIPHPRFVRGPTRLCIRLVHGLHAGGSRPRGGVVPAEDHRTHPHRVIFEDLEENEDGWDWGRDVVTLLPPNRWHMDGVGNRRDVTADYVLSPLPDGRTRFDLRW